MISNMILKIEIHLYKFRLLYVVTF